MSKTLIGTEESAAAVIWRCPVNNILRKILKILRKTPVLESFFDEVLDTETYDFIKK